MRASSLAPTDPIAALSRRLRSLRELRNLREAVRFTQVCCFAAAVPLLLRLPLPRLAQLLVRGPARRLVPVNEDVTRLVELVELAPRVAWPLVRTGCLTRGLTLLWFLRGAGLDVELRFGIDAEPSAETDGHCWLTLAGEPYLERVDPTARFTELYRLPLVAG